MRKTIPFFSYAASLADFRQGVVNQKPITEVSSALLPLSDCGEAVWLLPDRQHPFHEVAFPEFYQLPNASVTLVHMGEVGVGAFSTAPIPAEAPIAIYAGLCQPWSGKDPYDLEYSIQNSRWVVNPREKGNWSVFMQHAFSEHEACQLYYIPSEARSRIQFANVVGRMVADDAPEIFLFQAARDIPAQNILAWNYGAKYWYGSKEDPLFFTKEGKAIDPKDEKISSKKICICLTVAGVLQDLLIGLDKVTFIRGLLLHLEKPTKTGGYDFYATYIASELLSDPTKAFYKIDLSTPMVNLCSSVEQAAGALQHANSLLDSKDQQPSREQLLTVLQSLIFARGTCYLKAKTDESYKGTAYDTFATMARVILRLVFAYLKENFLNEAYSYYASIICMTKQYVKITHWFTPSEEERFNQLKSQFGEDPSPDDPEAAVVELPPVAQDKSAFQVYSVEREGARKKLSYDQFQRAALFVATTQQTTEITRFSNLASLCRDWAQADCLQDSLADKKKFLHHAQRCIDQAIKMAQKSSPADGPLLKLQKKAQEIQGLLNNVGGSPRLFDRNTGRNAGKTTESSAVCLLS